MTSMRVSSISIRRGSNDVLHATSIEIVEAFGQRYRDFRQKYARATSQPFRRAARVLQPGARLKLCQAQAVGRFRAEISSPTSNTNLRRR
jgi:hypothetical protein